MSCSAGTTAACSVVLMTNHEHRLLAQSDAGPVSALMQSLECPRVRDVNDRHGRNGTPCDGRHESCHAAVTPAYCAATANPLRAAKLG